MEFTDDEDDHLDQEEDDDDDDDEGITIPTPTPTTATASTVIRNGAGGGGGSHATTATTGLTRYRECQKNHAVSLGGHAVDGCGEFMPAGEELSLDALKCAACGCHRNFHRKESDISAADLAAAPASSSAAAMHHPQLLAPPSYYRTPVPPPHGYVHHINAYPHHRPLALPSSSGGRGTEEMEEFSNPSSSGGGGGSGNRKNKRFRTKFTAEQKERMAEFAERIGWRIQKQDEAAVQQFCQEVNVTRQVLKVWLHNNKHSLAARKP